MQLRRLLREVSIIFPILPIFDPDTQLPVNHPFKFSRISAFARLHCPATRKSPFWSGIKSLDQHSTNSLRRELLPVLTITYPILIPPT